MHRPVLFLTIATLFLAALRLPLSAADTVELKRHWIVGKKYYRTIQISQTMSFTISGIKFDQSVNSSIETSETVSRDGEGRGKRVAVKYEHITMDTTTNGQKSSFDSSKPDPNETSNPLASALGNFAGRQFLFLVDEEDQITGLDPQDEPPKKSGFSPPPRAGESKILNHEKIIEIMKKGTLLSMPDHPVKPGDQWPFATDIDLPQMGKVGVKGTYTLKRLADHDGTPCAEITSEASASVEFSQAFSAKPGAKAAVKLGMKLANDTIRGTNWFDPTLGVTRESHNTQEATITMRDPKNPDTTISIPIKQVTDTKLTKIEDVK